METKLYNKDIITLDGRMDEPVWNEVEEYTDFQKKKISGGGLASVQTSFKIITCEDRIYIGIKCMEPNMEYVTRVNPSLAMWTCDDVEIFLSPNCNYYDFYQFAITFDENFAAATGAKTEIYNMVVAVVTAVIIGLAPLNALLKG